MSLSVCLSLSLCLTLSLCLSLLHSISLFLSLSLSLLLSLPLSLPFSLFLSLYLTLSLCLSLLLSVSLFLSLIPSRSLSVSLSLSISISLLSLYLSPSRSSLFHCLHHPHFLTHLGRWTREEHHTFIKGLELYGKGWKKIASLIKTRTVVQIRTHAQKYFLKLTKARQSGDAVSVDGKVSGTGGRKVRF